MAPVELVGFTRREAQRDIGCRQRWTTFGLPALRIAPHRVIAAFVALTAQRLEYPHQRQALTRRLVLVRCQQLVEFPRPRSQLRAGLAIALVAKLRRLRTHNLANHLARDLQLPANRLDRLLLNEIGATYLCNRLHNQHPK